jgi:hypothetical protein
MPSFSVLPGSEGFLFSGPALVSQLLTPPAIFAGILKDQSMKHVRFTALVLAGVSLSAVLCCSAVDLREEFSGDPATNGWKVFGAAQLFAWDPAARNLQVTWDSSKTNSYFAKSLGTTLTRYDDFTVSFDLVLSNVSQSGSEIAVGLLNLANATNSAFLRGTGADSPDLFEFDYFPPTPDFDEGSITVMAIDYIGKTGNWSLGGYLGANLGFNAICHIELNHTGADQRIHTTMICNGQGLDVPDSYLGPAFLDFHVDHFAVCSYSDYQGWGSVFATGTIDNVMVNAVERPVAWAIQMPGTNSAWQAQVHAHTNWNYTLERTADFKSWTPVSVTVAGAESDVVLQDTNAALTKAFYRVRATAP